MSLHREIFVNIKRLAGILTQIIQTMDHYIVQTKAAVQDKDFGSCKAHHRYGTTQ